MKPVLLYLLQVVICSGILYGYYHLFLRNKRFHQYNRYYLLAATIVSVLVPFLNIPVYFSAAEEQPVWIHTLSGLSSPDSVLFISNPNAGNASFFTWRNLLTTLYILAAAFILVRFIISLLRIRTIIRKHDVEQIEDINFVNTEERGTPFSFFNWMFWNKKIALRSDDGQQIFRHELFHIREKHSRDIVFLEILTIIFWINPFFHLIKKELTAIHEFLADQFAIRENEQWNYAELLLMHLMGTPSLRLTHPFFHNQIKRRIAMITSSQQPKYQYLRKVLVLPLLVLVAILFAFTYKQKQEDIQEKAAANLEKETQLLLNRISPPDTPKAAVKTEAYTISAEKIVFRNNSQNTRSINVVDLYIIDGKKYNRAEVMKKYGEEIEFNGEVRITEANNAEAIQKYGVQATNGVIEFRKLGVTTVQGLLLKDNSLQEPLKNPLLVVNKVIQEIPASEVELNKIEPNSIREINVLKDKSAVDKYGDKGKNGVIEITTKPDASLVLARVEGKPVAETEVKELKIVPRKDLDEVVVMGYAKPKVQDEVVVMGYAKPKVQDEVVVVGYAKSLQKGDNKVFLQLDEEPSFPGGQEAWKKYLLKNLNANTPVDKGSPTGAYTVKVQFIVDKEGFISDIKSLTNHGYGMEEEVVRILKAGPRWIPGKQNGHTVTAYKQQPVTFVITDDPDKEEVTAGRQAERQAITISSTASDMDRLSLIYPNPATNNISIPYSTQTDGNGEVRIQDMSGTVKLVQKTNLSKGLNTLTINVASLAKGTYVVSILDGKQQLARTYKLVKQ